MVENEKTTCYQGRTYKAIETDDPKREDDRIDFLYVPELNAVILQDLKGRYINAYRVSPKGFGYEETHKEYLEGEEIKIEKGQLEKILERCTDLELEKHEIIGDLSMLKNNK